MRRHARFAAWLAAGIALACALHVHAQQRLNIAMHASAAERLAMLAERIGKTHLQMAQGVLVDRSRRALRDSVREFDALLPHVASLASDPESHDDFVLLGLLWKELRVWAHKPPTRDNARNVSERAEEVSWVASKGARRLNSGGSAQRSALGAMRAGTLAQRIARLYLLARIGAADARRHADLEDAKSRLAAALTALEASPHDAQVDAELRMASTQREFLLGAMRDNEAGGAPTTAELVAKTADHVADSMERASRLYENQAD